MFAGAMPGSDTFARMKEQRNLLEKQAGPPMDAAIPAVTSEPSPARVRARFPAGLLILGLAYCAGSEVAYATPGTYA